MSIINDEEKFGGIFEFYAVGIENDEMDDKKNKVFLAMIILLLALLCIGWEISLPYRTPVLVTAHQEIFSGEWQEFLQQQKVL